MNASSSPRLGGLRPLGSAEARRRRRRVLTGLGVAAFLTLVLALTAGGLWILLHLFVDALLLGFVLLVVQYHRSIEEHQIRSRQPHRPAGRGDEWSDAGYVAPRELLRQAR